jgi:hypothetical protein
MFLTRKKIQRVLLILSASGIGVFFGGAPEDGRQQALGAAPAYKGRDAKAVEPIPFPDGVIDAERRGDAFLRGAWERQGREREGGHLRSNRERRASASSAASSVERTCVSSKTPSPSADSSSFVS